MGIELNKDQIFASYDIEHWWHHSTKQLFQIEGAAGTGKTTIIRYFIDKMKLDMSKVLFVSYMGKAVSQMIRNGLPARTIHASCYNYIKELAKDENGKLIMNDYGKPKIILKKVLKDKLPGKISLIVVDEGYMVPEELALDLMSFGVPIIVLGDTNQLPPVFGKAYFLDKPDVILHEIMRQKENDPIIFLSQMVLRRERLRPCMLGKSGVIEKKYLTKEQLADSDVVITGTNQLRGAINKLFREDILSIDNQEYPNLNEKIICRKNNWDEYIKDNGKLFLTNGLAGYVDNILKSTYNKNNMVIDFKPDFSRKVFKNTKISIPYINTEPGQNSEIYIGNDINAFEYAYAITAHLSQGSQYNKVTVLQESHLASNTEYFTALMYTAITRAIDSVRIVI